MHLIRFQETNDDFFHQKSQRLFRPLQLRHSMDVFYSVSGNKRGLFFKRVNVFFGDNSYDIQWMYLIRFQETNDDFFFLQKSRLLFRQQQLLHSMDALDSVSGNKRRFFFLQKSPRLFRRQQLQLRHSMDVFCFCDFSK